MDVYEDVVERLVKIGFHFANEDRYKSEITDAISHASVRILSDINRTDIPEGLRTVLVDMSAGLFLSEKKSTGTLGDFFEFTAPVKRLTEGDVSIEYGCASDGSDSQETRFYKLIDSMINPPAEVLIRYRRFAW